MLPRSRPKISSYPKIIAGFLLGFVVLASLIEGSFRLFVPMDALVYQDSLDPQLRFELKPKSHGVKNNVLVEISEQGLRDRVVPDSKEPGEFRVVFVGDHPTFGVGVPAEETFVKQIGPLLKVPAHIRPTTINLSMYHYSLPQKFQLLRTRGPQFRPDFVVLQISAGDSSSIARPKYPWPKLKNFLRANSRFVRWVMERSYWRRKPAKVTDEPARRPGEDPLLIPLRSVKEYLAEQELPLLVVYVPDLVSTDPESIQKDHAYAEKIAAFCAKEKVDFYNAEDAFRFFAPQTLLIYHDTPWLNAKGHQALAEGLSKQLSKRIQNLPLIKQKPAR